MVDATILIVDDDRTIVRLCQRLLERASFSVVATLDPLEALQVLDKQKIDLLLSDIRMPVMDGFELITRARQFQPDLPVLVMTGFGSVDTAIQALHRGVDGLILKPFENSSDLVQAVQRVLEESRQKRDAARLQVLRPLFDVSERLLSETSPLSLEHLIVDAVMNLFQAQYAGIYRQCHEDEVANLELIRLVENDQQPVEESETLRNLLLRAVSGHPASMINATGPGEDALQSLLKEIGYAGMLVASVKRNANEFVFLAAREGSALPFSESDLEMFTILARQSAVALENARLYTELKNYIHQVEDSQRALIQAEKMAAVGRLMASLAHEINNPLQAVRNCLHLAARRDLEVDQRLLYLNMTDSELDRLVSTVRRMLDFSRPGRVEKEDVDIQAMMDRILALLQPQMRAQHIHVETQYFGAAQLLWAVPDQIQQVFFNLLLNSMDAMEEQSIDKHIWVDIYYEKHQIRFSIEDSGPGFPNEMQKRIFEPFVSTKKNGTGLGLAVSYGIIERHKGSMATVDPQHQQGARFEIILPVELKAENG